METMKGDPFLPVECPVCHKRFPERTVHEVVTRKENTTTGRQRAALYRHFAWSHPELGVRERSLIADRAIEESQGLLLRGAVA